MGLAMDILVKAKEGKVKTVEEMDALLIAVAKDREIASCEIGQLEEAIISLATDEESVNKFLVGEDNYVVNKFLGEEDL